MHIVVPAFATKPVMVASVHALTDATRSPRELAPYAMALVPLPSQITSGAFVAASVSHFATDVGGALSVALHVTWWTLRKTDHEVAAWCLFALFYAFVHALPSVLAWSRAVSSRASRVQQAFVFALLVGVTVPARAFVVTDWMQRLIVAHAFVARASQHTGRPATTHSHE